MTDSTSGGRRRLSRRKILWAIGATGAAASGGGGVAALLSDSERAGAELTAGTLDLETAWGNSEAVGNDGAVVDRVPSIDLGSATMGDTGTFEAFVSVSDNPAYVWFCTGCPAGTDAEEAIDVTVSLESDGTLLDTLASGSLDQVREDLGSGVRLDGELSPDETWRIVIDWEVTESVDEQATVVFDFEFHATQTRHVDAAGNVAPVWPGCDGDSSHAISWIAFCTDEPIDDGDISYSVDGSTLTYDLDSGYDLTAVLLKYSTFLDEFSSPAQADTLEVGDGTTYEAQGNNGNGNGRTEYAGGRTNSTPCPDGCGYKYEVNEDNVERKCNGDTQ